MYCNAPAMDSIRSSWQMVVMAGGSGADGCAPPIIRLAGPDMPGGMGPAWHDPGMLHAGVPILFWRPGVTVMTSPADTSAYRSEKDSFGPIDVPAGRLWGAQTQRSLQHFAISVERMAPELIRALARVKRASACVNHALGLLDAAKTRAIVAAADEVIAGGHWQEFPLVVWQTGSGTQTNMNMNEVLAN